MTQPYIGQIQPYAFNFAPKSWAFCNGQILPIAQNQALFSLLGTTYGGNGVSTFALPNLQSRVPMHMGTGPDGTTYQIGEMAGTEQETLSTQQIPSHTHAFTVSTDAGTSNNPIGSVVAKGSGIKLFLQDVPTSNKKASAITPAGGSQPHENTQPFLCINFIISLFGIFPSQT